MAEEAVNENRAASSEAVTTPLPIYSDVEINDLPDPEWLVEGLFQERTVAAIYGPTEGGKTFLALDFALSIATGGPFHGLNVAQTGVVVYVYAEGGPNLKFRVHAWKLGHDLRLDEPCHVFFIPISVNLVDDRGSGLNDLLRTVRSKTSKPIALVVIDTLAACFGGKNEDSTQDMNSFTNRCAKIRDELGCTVLVVHHTGRDSSRERGNLSLKNNIDTMIRCSRVKKGIVELECEKQKDAPYFEPFQLILEEVQLSEEQTSCVLRSPDQEQSELPLL
ncbi:MAG: AAA family ATPase, partial [Acidobacteriota bacterium]